MMTVDKVQKHSQNIFELNIVISIKYIFFLLVTSVKLLYSVDLWNTLNRVLLVILDSMVWLAA